jgi:hypothetical protein
MSRRFRNRHAKVVADPAALPVPPVALNDSNSYVDVLQPDRRIPLTLNSRAFVVAESSLAKDDYVEVADTSKPEPTALERLASLKAQIAELEAAGTQS